MKAEIGSPDVVMGDFIQDLIGDIEYNMQLAPPNDQYFEELSIQKFTLQQLLQEIGRHEGDSPTAVVARFVERNTKTSGPMIYISLCMGGTVTPLWSSIPTQ
jgi:hypothetical protein